MRGNLTISSAAFAVCVLLVVAGSPVEADMGEEFTITAQDFNEYLPDVAYNTDRDEYFVVWHDNTGWQARSIMGRRYTDNGTLIGEYVIAFEDSPQRDNAQPAVAYDPVNKRYLVVWSHDSDGFGGDYDIHGRFVPWNGPIAGLSAFTINNAASKQWRPRVAFGGTVQEFMVTWWNEAYGGNAGSISAQRVAAASNLVGTVIGVTSHQTEERVVPDIAYNQARNEYLVVYQKMEAGGGDISGVRLAGNGAILGGGDFGIAGWPDAETAPSVAASQHGNCWAVAWHSQVAQDHKDVFARLVRVDETGTVQMEDVVTIANWHTNESHPDIAAHPARGDFLVAFERQYSNPTNGDYGIGARVLTTANQLGAEWGVRLSIAGQLAACSQPAVAAGTRDWLIAWEHTRTSPAYQDIRGRIIDDYITASTFEYGNFVGWSLKIP